MLFYCYDHRRRRWAAGSISQAPRHVPAYSQGQFHGLAFGSDHQFSSNAIAIPTGESSFANKSGDAKLHLAFCINSRYRMDSISLPLKRR